MLGSPITSCCQRWLNNLYVRICKNLLLAEDLNCLFMVILSIEVGGSLHKPAGQTIVPEGGILLLLPENSSVTKVPVA